ncbi:type 1 fimbrial protein [Pantoea sp. PNT02]|uniref:fimbrial protein n=1 Tax=Pantoea sp. PNT02 TaxID=2769261 RepID=UPI0017868374|nr:fimbrial protein [Pantoea sp. PNT02]MBD9646302.1 type 1 fimbrial protein [Pantoea sp. PNT02]
MFKKALVAAALLSAFSFNAANAVDGTITFTGRIIATTCDINGGPGGSVDIPVAMGTYGADQFGASGSTVGSVPFQIALTNCDAALTSASVLFEGTQDAANPQLLALTTGGTTADNVGIGIYESNGSTQIPLNTSSASQTLNGNAATLNFIAKYVSTDATVTEGDANAVANFTIQYP